MKDMNKKFAVILAGIYISVFGIVTISEAQTMKNEGLNAKQEKSLLLRHSPLRAICKN
jgi:hypothetical protein